MRNLTWSARLGAGLAAAAALGAVTTGPVTAVQVPPSDKVFIREMPWACGELGSFVASYNVMGKNPPVMWLSRDGSRADGVMVLLVDGQLTWTYGDGSTQTFGPSETAPPVPGLAQYRCDLAFSAGDASVQGWARVAVVRGAGAAA